jgi:hypothetical protein
MARTIARAGSVAPVRQRGRRPATTCELPRNDCSSRPEAQRVEEGRDAANHIGGEAGSSTRSSFPERSVPGAEVLLGWHVPVAGSELCSESAQLVRQVREFDLCLSLVRSTVPTCSTNQDASEAVIVPSNAIPPIISATATYRPSAVVGKRSPYPTVVIVVTDHHRASPKEVMFASADVHLISRWCLPPERRGCRRPRARPMVLVSAAPRMPRPVSR